MFYSPNKLLGNILSFLDYYNDRARYLKGRDLKFKGRGLKLKGKKLEVEVEREEA